MIDLTSMSELIKSVETFLQDNNYPDTLSNRLTTLLEMKHEWETDTTNESGKSVLLMNIHILIAQTALEFVTAPPR